MRSDLQALYPTIYRGILETDLLCEAGDAQFNDYFSAMDAARQNQFALTADATGITALERIYEIRANPAAEDLEFRRQRLLNRMRMKVPFTFAFLLERLDEVIGKDKYKAWISRGDWCSRLGSWQLGVDPMREQPYTLYVSTAAKHVSWYEEIHVFVEKIKPANIVFAMNPLIRQGFVMHEQIDAATKVYNYTLGNWKLGAKAFESKFPKEMVKVPYDPSLTAVCLQEHARLTAAQVVKVRLNGSVLVDNLQKVVVGQTATFRYIVTAESGLNEITRIELLGEDGDVRSESLVFIPIPATGQVVLEHSIPHEERIE